MSSLQSFQIQECEGQSAPLTESKDTLMFFCIIKISKIKYKNTMNCLYLSSCEEALIPLNVDYIVINGIRFNKASKIPH
jgi:hypothetical protein